jgi:hypothetical protein
MTPLRLCTNPDVIIPQRISAYNCRQTTNHWPHEFYPTEEGATVACLQFALLLASLNLIDFFRLQASRLRWVRS